MLNIASVYRYLAAGIRQLNEKILGHLCGVLVKEKKNSVGSHDRGVQMHQALSDLVRPGPTGTHVARMANRTRGK